MVEEDGRPKAYGAGLLSSYEELLNYQTNTPKLYKFEVERTITTAYPSTGLQPIYFVANNMKDMRNKLM